MLDGNIKNMQISDFNDKSCAYIYVYIEYLSQPISALSHTHSVYDSLNPYKSALIWSKQIL